MTKRRMSWKIRPPLRLPMAHIFIPFKPSRIGELATVNPGTDLTVGDASGKQPFCCRVIKCRAAKTLYLAAGQRLALATLSEEVSGADDGVGNGRLTSRQSMASGVFTGCAYRSH